MILIILSLAIILTYVGVMVKRNGIPDSISDTFYALEHKLWFGTTMWLTSSLLMPSILDRTPDTYQFMAFLMCAGLMVAGIAPNFKKGIDRPIHITAATIAAVSSQAWVAVMNPAILFVWIAWFVHTLIGIKENWNGDLKESFLLTKPLFWAEAIAFILVYITLIF